MTGEGNRRKGEKGMKTEKDRYELIELYENTIKELHILLEEGKTWEDYALEEYKDEIRRFWKISDVWGKAWKTKIYSEERLNKDFEAISTFAKRLLL